MVEKCYISGKITIHKSQIPNSMEKQIIHNRTRMTRLRAEALQRAGADRADFRGY
jgi:hypothetical protein